MDKILRVSPLSRYWETEEGARIHRPDLLLCEEPFTGLVRLQLGRSADRSVCSRIEDIVGCELPRTPASNSSSACTVLWMSERDWLISVAPNDEHALASHLAVSLESASAAVNIVTDSKTLITAEGSNVRDMLAVGCSIDLHPGVFTNDYCVQTLLGRVQIVLRKTSIRDQFQIFVDRTYAAFLWEWLREVALEF